MERMDKMALISTQQPMLGGTKQGTRPRRYSYWRTGYGHQTSPNLDFWVAQAGEYHCLPHFEANEAEHPHRLQFYYQTKGQAHLTDKTTPGSVITAGDILIIPPNHSFTYQAEQRIQLHWCAIAGNLPTICNYQTLVCLSVGQNVELAEKFHLLREALIRQKQGYALQAIAIFYEILALLTQAQSEEPLESQFPDTIRRALTHIEENYQIPFDVHQLAEHVGVSSSYLRQLFRKWVGESPQQHHTRHRIAAAKRMLTTQALNVKEVAEHVGYSDPYHFSRVFKKITGSSPSTVRK